MTVILNDRDDVTLDAFERVAFGQEPIELGPRALERIAEAHAAFQIYLAHHGDDFIYSVTSGTGPDAGATYTLEEARARLSTQESMGLSFGGPPLPEYVVRGAVFGELSTILDGHTAMDPQKATSIARMLSEPLPVLPSRGLSGAGELMSLYILFAHLTLDDGQGLGAGTGDNGAATAASMVSVCSLLSARRLRLAERAFALTLEALNAPIEPYDPAGETWDDASDKRARGALWTLLDADPTRKRELTIAASELDVVISLLGEAHRSLEALHEAARISLRESSSNPAYLIPDDSNTDGRVCSHGGFHNAIAAPAIDAMAASWAELGALAHRASVRLHQEWASRLPDQLLPPGAHNRTITSTTNLEYVPNDFVEEMRRLAQPTLLSFAEISLSSQDDVAIPTPLAFRVERQVADCFDATLAVLIVCASQALAITDRQVPPSQQPFLDAVRVLFPPVDTLRPLGEECAHIASAIGDAVEWRAGPFQSYVEP
jgi:histidine ammonia-lyase